MPRSTADTARAAVRRNAQSKSERFKAEKMELFENSVVMVWDSTVVTPIRRTS